MLAPNTPKNNATFEKWSTSEQQTSAFLGDSLEQCQRVVLRAGDTLFLPSGWPHAVSTPEDSFVLGGNFLHSLDYESIAHVYRSEVRLGVQPKFQFPLFRRLMWHAARCAVDTLKACAAKEEEEEEDHVGKAKEKRSTASKKVKRRTAVAVVSSPLVIDPTEMNQWECRGLPALLSLLQDWQKEPSAARRVDVPDEIDDADAFLEEMEELLERVESGAAVSSGAAAAAAKKKNTQQNGHKQQQAKRSINDCGTPPTDEEDASEEEEEEEEDKNGDFMKDRRRPEKRTKQLASLVQLKEALAARASKPKKQPSSSPPQINTTTATTGTAGPGTAKNNKVSVITLSSTDDDSDSEPIYISSSSDDDEKGTNGTGTVRDTKKKVLAPPAAPAAGGVVANRGLKSSPPSLPARKKPQQQQQQKQVKKTSEVVVAYKPPASLDLKPLGRKQEPQPVSRRNKTLANHSGAGAAQNLHPSPPSPSSSPTSERAVALKQIAEMRKLEQDLQREERLLGTVVGGGVALKDSGKKLEARVTARRHQLESMKNILEGRVLYFNDEYGQKHGPFTSRELDLLIKSGSSSAPDAIEKVNGGNDKEKGNSVFLTLEEAISLPIPLTAMILKEESDRLAKEMKEKEQAAARAAGVGHHQQQQKERVGGVQKKKRSKNRSRPRKEYNEPYFSHNNNHTTEQPWQQQQQQQPNQRPAASRQQKAGPSVWEIAAATTATITQQESDPIWTYKLPQTGEYKGPFSTAELRRLYFTGDLKDDIMVHDEDGGVSTSLLTLLGVPRNTRGGATGSDSRYEIEPYRVPSSQHTISAAATINKKQGGGVEEAARKKEDEWRRWNEERAAEETAKVKLNEKIEGMTKEKQVDLEPEPYAVTIGRQFALSQPLPAPLPSAAQPASSPLPFLGWGSYAQPQPQAHVPSQHQQREHAPYYNGYHPPPGSAQQAHQQAPASFSYQGASSGSWAAASPAQPQYQHRPPPHVPMTNAPRPMVRAVGNGLGAGLGPMRPAAELVHYEQQHRHQQEQQQQQQGYYNAPNPHTASHSNGNGYWNSRS